MTFDDYLLPRVAFDWNGAQLDYTFDGVTRHKVKGVNELLDILDGPHVICCEVTVESFKVEQHTAFVQRCSKEGHVLLGYNPRLTAKYRHTHLDIGVKMTAEEIATQKQEKKDKKRDEIGIEKDKNVHDALVVFAIASEGIVHLDLIKERYVREDFATLRDDYRIVRAAGQKDELIDNAVAVLLEANGIKVDSNSMKNCSNSTKLWKHMPNDLRCAFGNGKGDKPNRLMIGTVFFATAKTTSRSDFEDLLGLHGSGYPSIFRSDMLNWGYSTASKGGMTLKQYRRETRRLRSIFKAAGIDASTELVSI